MTTRASPSVIQSPRSAQEVAGILQRLLHDTKTGRPEADLLREALTQIAARYGEIISRCINSAPDRHLEAFAELLGGKARPAAAARVHVSFKPATGGTGRSVRVPMYTRVALQSEGAGEPAVFETLEDLTLLRAAATRALFLEAGHWQAADVSLMLTQPGLTTPPSVFPVAYAFHVGHRTAFSVSGLQQVKLQVAITSLNPPEDGSQFDWIVETAKENLPLKVESDTTSGMTKSGEVVLAAPQGWPMGSVGGIELAWLTLRLRQAPTLKTARWRSPRLTSLRISIVAAHGPLPVTAACADGISLDMSKDAFPLGERPRFGSVFQLLSPAFAQPGAQIEMMVLLTNPEGATASPIPPVS